MPQTLTIPQLESTPQPEASLPTAPLLERLQETVSLLAQRPILFWSLLLAVNALTLPYHGFSHDARLYGAQVMERVEPGSFAEDLYLQYGSQDRFTFWTPLTAPLIALLGLPVAYLLFYYVSKGLFYWAAMRLVRRLLNDDTATVLSLIVVAMLPLPFGGHRTFHLNESFLTPRILAPTLVMFSVERMLAGRPMLALLLQGFAVALHPLMALAGIVTYVFWGWLRVLPGWRFVVSFLMVSVAAAGVVLYEPLGYRLFGYMDDEWRTINLRVCFFIRPETWNWADWWTVGLAFVAGILAALHFRREQARFLWAVILAGFAGLAGSLVAVFSHYLVLIQVSPYRTLWLLQFLATPLFFLAIVKLWRKDTPISRTTSLALLLLIAPIDWEYETRIPSQFVMLALFAIVACFYWGFSDKTKDNEQPAWAWLLPSALATFVLGFLYLCIYDAGLILIFAATPPNFQLDMHPIHKLLVTFMALYKLPLLFAVLAMTRWLLANWRPRAVTAGLLLFMLAYHPFIAFVPKTAVFGERYSIRFPHHRFVADFVQARTTPETGKRTIYWANDIRYHWYLTQANCYFNWVQLSGSAFDRDNAIEGKRRALLARPFEIAALLASPQKEAWALPFARFFDIQIPPGRKAYEVLEEQPEPCRADLLRLCQETHLDYVILEVGIDDLYCASSGKFFIYDCQALRQRQ